MKKIAMLMLFLIIISCTPKEGKTTEMPAQEAPTQVTEQQIEPITCCCELPDTNIFLRKEECYGNGNCVEDSKCLEKQEISVEEKEKETVDIAMGKIGYPAGDLTQRICCIVPLPRARAPYEKAFDTTRARCIELKGTEEIWEKCYEEVCCERIGRLVKRKFMECKSEGGTIVEKEKCS